MLRCEVCELRVKRGNVSEHKCDYTTLLKNRDLKISELQNTHKILTEKWLSLKKSESSALKMVEQKNNSIYLFKLAVDDYKKKLSKQ